MALPQQKFREIVLQLLYSHTLSAPEDEVMVALIMGELAISKRNVRLALDRVAQIKEHLGEIDEFIRSVSTSYDLNRIQLVTLTILRLGIFELFYDEQIPPKVVIAEAVRLSRKFNTPESASFVNAILDNLYHTKIGDGQADSTKVQLYAEAMERSNATSIKEAMKQKELLLWNNDKQVEEP